MACIINYLRGYEVIPELDDGPVFVELREQKENLTNSLWRAKKKSEFYETPEI